MRARGRAPDVGAGRRPRRRGPRRRAAAGGGGRSGAARARPGVRAARRARSGGRSSASHPRWRSSRASGRERRLAMGARRVGRPAGARGRRRSVLARRRGVRLQRKRGLVEDLPLLGLGRRDPAGVTLERAVGRPEQQPPGPGNREGDSCRSIGIVTARPSRLTLDDQMRAASVSVTDVPARASSSRRTSSIHGPAALTTARTPSSSTSPDSVSRTWATGPPSGRPMARAVDHDGAALGRAPRRFARHNRASSVCGVRIEACGAETVEPQRRYELRRSRGRDHAAALGDGSRSSPRTTRGRRGSGSARMARRDRPEHEVQRPHEMGSDESAQRVHLGLRLAHQAEVADPR